MVLEAHANHEPYLSLDKTVELVIGHVAQIGIKTLSNMRCFGVQDTQ